MKPASAELIGLMAGNEFRLADLYTITLASGTVLHYTSFDLPITYGVDVYTPAPIERGRTRIVRGVEVDTLDVRIFPTDSMLVNGNGFLSACYAGAFDGALLKLERAYMATWGNTSPGALHLFEGRVSDIELDGLEVKISVRSMLELLNIKMPRTVYQAACANSLYDAGCGASRATYAVNGTVSTGTKSVVNTALAQASGYFEQGVIKFLTGNNAGVSRTVKSFAGGVFTLSVPLAYTAAPGDTFTAWPGCDKTLTTCTSKFNNKAKFRGFPWIPVPETAY